MTDPQQKALSCIWDKIRTKAADGGFPLPLLCYALDPGVISPAEYDILRHMDMTDPQVYQTWHYTNGKAKAYLALPLVLLWVRRFYEGSDGGDLFRVMQGRDGGQGAKADIRADIRALLRQYRMDEPTGNKWRDWMLSQCWVIRAADRGQTSELLKQNAAVYQTLCERFNPDELMESLLERDGRVTDYLQGLDPAGYEREVPPYIAHALKHHPAEYSLSLCALVQGGDSPWREQALQAHPWLEPLWGAAEGVRFQSGDKLEWFLCKNGAYSLVLRCTADSPDKGGLYLEQGGKRLELEQRKVQFLDIPTLEEAGIDPFQYIRTGTGGMPAVLPGDPDTPMAFFEPVSLLTPVMKGHDEFPLRRGRRICILSTKQPDGVTLNGIPCPRAVSPHREAVALGRGCSAYAYLYDIPDIGRDAVKGLPLCVTAGGRDHVPARLSRRPAFIIRNTEEAPWVENEPDTVVTVGRHIEVDTRNAFAPARGEWEYCAGSQAGVSYIRGIEPGTKAWLTYTGYSGKQRRQSVLLLPPDWKQQARHAGTPAERTEDALNGVERYDYNLQDGTAIRLQAGTDKAFGCWRRAVGWLENEYRHTPFTSMQTIVDERWELAFHAAGEDTPISYTGSNGQRHPLPFSGGNSMSPERFCQLMRTTNLPQGAHVQIHVGDCCVYDGIMERAARTAATPLDKLKRLLQILADMPPTHPATAEGYVESYDRYGIGKPGHSELFEHWRDKLLQRLPADNTRKLKAALRAIPARTGARHFFIFACTLRHTQATWERIRDKRQQSTPGYLGDNQNIRQLFEETCALALKKAPYRQCLAVGMAYAKTLID